MDFENTKNIRKILTNEDNNMDFENNNENELPKIYSKIDFENRKLKESVRDIKKRIPKLFNEEISDEENLNYLIKQVFREDYTNTLYFTNASFYNPKKNKDTIRLYLRPQKGTFLQDRIPDDLTLSFRGYIKEGFFYINEIHITSEYNGKKPKELEIKIIPYHTNIPKGYRGEYLFELIDNSESVRKSLSGKLKDWMEYLSWRKELVKKRLVGIKYLRRYQSYDSKNDLHKIVFLLVAPSKEEFDNFRKYLRRENMKIFDNDYSTEEYKFRYNEENRGKIVDLGEFVEIIKERKATPEEIEEYRNPKNRGKSKNKKNKKDNYNNDENNEFENKIEIFSENSYFVEIAFEIAEDDYDKIKKENFNNDEEKKEFIDNIINEINKDGFLALSAVGDFVLLRRLERAIEELESDEGYSPNLASWLFDIKEADAPSKEDIENINIEKWFNKGIENNENQNLAVRKMIATKDVCLIQGPPGTGKTTVIAEAIYQFALRGERVLVASQTNLAVDNALERLAKEPVIRAIRLNVSKTTEDIAHMTEDKVLEYFFKNISTKLKENYLNNWENNEKLLNNIEIHLRYIGRYLEQKNHYNNRLNQLLEEKNNLNKNIEELNNSINEIKNKNSEINGIKNQLNMFYNFINGNNKESEIDFVLPKDFISIILNDIRTHLNLLNDINLDRLNIRNIDINDTEDYILTNGLKEIFKNVDKFNKLNYLVSNVSKSDNKSNPILESLKSKRDELMDKMKVMVVNNENEKEYNELFDEFNKIKKEISEFKDDTFELKKTHKALLTDNIKNEFMASKNIDIIKNVIDKNKEEVDNIKKVLSNMNTYLNDYKSTLKEEDYKQKEKEKENELKSSEGRLSVIVKDENKTREYLKGIDNKINELKKENNIENDIEGNDIYNLLENKMQELLNIIKESEEIKNKFGDFIKEFNNKLENIDIDYENEYYKETYINSCNVVGISCTENSKILEDKGFQYFDVAIIDEVSKATPPELLIPMLKAKKVILVGDHRQLPPLFREHEKSYKEMIDSINEDMDESEEVKEILTEENFKKFEKMVTSSIFKEYFEEANENIKHSLLSQFRMHSDIMGVINRFYENKLKSGLLELGMTKEKENETKAHLLEIKRVNNHSFITKSKHAYWIDSSDIIVGQNRAEKIYESMIPTSTSIYNILEAHIAVELVKKIATEYKKLNLGRKVSVGIISLYQLQVNRIREMIKEERNKFDFSAINIDVNTVDRFQGKEKEIVIVSLVRNPESEKSYSKHIRAFERVNVAFSRAQNALFIIGAETLYKNLDVEIPYMDKKGSRPQKVYKNIIEHLERKASRFESDCVIDYNKAKSILNEYNKYHKNNKNSLE